MTSRLALAASILVIVVMLAPAVRVSEGVANAQQSAGQRAEAQQQPNMQDMMKMHEQMMAEMKAANAKLDQLTQKMDSATGNGKIDATAAVVKELVAQNRAMCDRMVQVHQQMMGGRGMMMNK